MPATSLPVELWEIIIGYLDKKTHLSLRLTSKQISDLNSGPTFRNAVEDQRIEFTSQSLKSFSALSIHPEYGPLVKDVSVVIPLCLMSADDDGGKESFDEHSVLTLLRTCFESLGRLRCIKLQAKGAQQSINSLVDGHGQREITRAYSITLLAAIEANIALNQLDLTGIPLKTTDVLLPFKLRDASKFATSLKCLSLRMYYVSEWKDSQGKHEDYSAQALYDLHTLCSGIETLILDVHGTEDMDTEHERVFHEAAECYFPNLQKFQLSISFLDAETLIDFLKHHPGIADLTLDELIYTLSDWEQICLTIQGAMPCLTRLELGEHVQVKESYYNLAPIWDAGNGSGQRREFNRQEIQGGYFVGEIKRAVGITSPSS